MEDRAAVLCLARVCRDSSLKGHRVGAKCDRVLLFANPLYIQFQHTAVVFPRVSWRIHSGYRDMTSNSHRRKNRLIISSRSGSAATVAMLVVDPLRCRVATVPYEGVRSKPIPRAVSEAIGPLPDLGTGFRRSISRRGKRMTIKKTTTVPVLIEQTEHQMSTARPLRFFDQ